MAMSRCLGGTMLTTWSPITSRPPLTSSRPATMRSAVDLPHPEGPTRIMNSPSSMSRSNCLTASNPSSKRLVTLSNVISAIVVLLSLDCACGEAGDDPALEDEDHHDDRDGHDD